MRSVSRRIPLMAVVAGTMLASPLAAQQKVVLPKKDAPLSGRPTAVFAVGKEEGESWEMLSNVQAVTFDREDNLYVLDSGNFRVLVFDRSGKFLRQIGKQGNGPGELTFPLGMAIAPNGNLVIADMGRTGYAVFKTDGTYVENVAAPEGLRGVAGTGGLYVDASGSIISRSMPGLGRLGEGRRGEVAALASGGPVKSPIVRHAISADAKPTTLYEIPMPAPKVEDRPGAGGRGAMRMVMFAPATFSPPIAWGALPNGSIAVAHEPEYAIRIVDPQGKVARIVEREEKPRKVTKRDQERAKEQRRKTLSSPGGGGGIRVTNDNGRSSFGFGGSGQQMTEDQIREQLDNMTFAEVIPMIQAVRTDPLGRIWVMRAGEIGEPGPIDLLAGDGRYIGTLAAQKMPDGFSSSGLAAYIERDDLDVQRIAVRRLPATWLQGVTGAGRVGDQ